MHEGTAPGCLAVAPAVAPPPKPALARLAKGALPLVHARKWRDMKGQSPLDRYAARYVNFCSRSVTAVAVRRAERAKPALASSKLYSALALASTEAAGSCVRVSRRR
jgi:hypothetical protein